MTLIDDLTNRGLIAQHTDIRQIRNLLTKPQTIYCGFDPTAGSLHIGHLVPLILLKRFQTYGHNVIALIGGATGLIGDPSFKANERQLNSKEMVSKWVEQLKGQITYLLAKDSSASPTIVNNADWSEEINIIDFFRDVGKHFSVNAMINRESVKQRLLRPEQGISFTEFSYTLLQSFDFAELNRRYDCKLQLGGNDQWGNILSGIELTRRRNKQDVFGLTLPLITKSDGVKFGKTESGAIWLDANKTSPYSFYQFWLSTEDADVYHFLRYYTFLSCDEILAIESADRSSKNKPIAQQILAEKVTRFVHGDEALKSAQRITNLLFNGSINQLQLAELKQLELDGLPCCRIDKSNDVVETLVKSGLASSKRNAKELISSHAIRINGNIVDITSPTLGFPLYDEYWLIQKGKKHFCLITRSF